MDKDKNPKKDEDSIKKLEDEFKKLDGDFHDFQKEWKEFRTNDFKHLLQSVDTLIKQGDGMQQNIVTVSGDIQMLKNCVTAIDQGIIELLKRGP